MDDPEVAARDLRFDRHLEALEADDADPGPRDDADPAAQFLDDQARLAGLQGLRELAITRG